MAGVKGRSGGYRSGSGRRPATVRIVKLHGGKDRGVARPVVPAAVAVDRPDGLSGELGATWDELAPMAVQAGTLVANTRTAFLRLCQQVVRHAYMDARITEDGLTYLKVTIDGSGQEHTEVKAHPLISRAQALDNAIRAGFKDFAINPFGKPIAEQATPADPFAEFDQERRA